MLKLIRITESQSHRTGEVGRDHSGVSWCPEHRIVSSAGLSPVRETSHLLWAICSVLGHCTGRKFLLMFRWEKSGRTLLYPGLVLHLLFPFYHIQKIERFSET